METKLFNFGSFKYAVDFTKTTNKLAKYMAVIFNYGGPKAKQSSKDNKKMKIDLRDDPEFVELYVSIQYFIIEYI